MKSVRPGLAIHAHAGTVAPFVAKALINFQRARLWIEVHHVEAVLPVFP